MKLIVDFLPIAIFAIVYFSTKSFYTATIVLIAATVIQISLLWILTKKTDKIHLVTLALLIFFGGITISLKDPIYLQWKPSVVNWLFAIVLLGSHFVGEKTVIQYLLSGKITLRQQAWRNLNMMWAIFFIFSGIINLYVALNFSESFWVQFKLFGQLLITISFLTGQSLYLYQQMKIAAQQPNLNDIKTH